MLAACAASLMLSGAANAESGIASVYSYEGDHTASGESAHPSTLTGAHRTLAFGTRVEVTNKRNGKTVVVRINDRGPFLRGRVIDLTPAAAQILDFSGLTPVSITVVN
jgi:rare lipoprotein A